MRTSLGVLLVIGLVTLTGCEPTAQPPANPYQNPYQSNSPPNTPPAPAPSNPTPPPASTPPASTPPQTTPPVAKPPTATPPVVTKPMPKPEVKPVTPTPRPKKKPIVVRMDLVPVGQTETPVASPVSLASRDRSINWSVTADPVPIDLQLGEVSKLRLKIPSGDATQRRVLLPATPTAFIALGVNEGSSQREVWDVRSQAKLGTISGLQLGGTPFQALSADGKYFAANPQGSGVIGVFDVLASSPLNVVNIDSDQFQAMGIAGKSRLWWCRDDVIHTLDIPTWTELSQKAVPTIPSPGRWSTSGGGNYLLFPSKENGSLHANILDFNQGETVGRLQFGAEAEFLGSGFSADGESVAVLVRRGKVASLSLWNMANGELQSDVSFSHPIVEVTEADGCVVTWSPAGEHILLGQRGLYDVSKGELTQVLAHESQEDALPVGAGQVAVVEGDRFAIIESTEGSGDSPSDAELQATLTSNEVFDDGPLPPLTAPDRSEVKILRAEDRWDYIPRRAKIFSKKVINKPVDIPAGQIYGASISNGEWPYAAMLYSETALDPTKTVQAASQSQRVWIEWFELRSGTKKKSFDLPFVTTLEDIDQDAKQIVTRIANGMDRLDVWALKDGAHLFGFRPYQSVDNPTGAAIESVQFVNDGSHLLTMGGGKLTLWTVPDCKAVFELSVGKLKPVISPALDTAVVSSPDEAHVYFVNLKNHKVSGTLASNGDPESPVTSFAFSPDGQSGILFTRRGTGSSVIIQDLAYNKQEHGFSLPVPAHSASWVDEGHVLIDGKRLLKIKDYAIGWTYDLPAGMHLEDSPNQKHWYLAADGSDFALVNVTLPDQAALSTLKSKSVVTEILLSSGESISVKNNIDSKHAPMMKPLEDHLKADMAKKGFKVASNQVLQLTIESIQEPTGRDLVGKLIGELPGTLRAPEIAIEEETLTLQVSLLNRGNVLWQETYQATNPGPFEFILDTAKDEITQAAIEHRESLMWNAVLQKSLSSQLPEIVFGSGAESGIGTTTLSVRGIR